MKPIRPLLNRSPKTYLSTLLPQNGCLVFFKSQQQLQKLFWGQAHLRPVHLPSQGAARSLPVTEPLLRWACALENRRRKGKKDQSIGLRVYTNSKFRNNKSFLIISSYSSLHHALEINQNLSLDQLPATLRETAPPPSRPRFKKHRGSLQCSPAVPC